MYWSCFPPGIQSLLVFYSIASLLLVGFAAVYLQTSAKLRGSSRCEIGNSLKWNLELRKIDTEIKLDVEGEVSMKDEECSKQKWV